MLGQFFSHPWPLKLCWTWCGVQGVTFLGIADPAERLGLGPQGAELGCLPLTLIPGPEGAEGSIFKAIVCLWGIAICCRWHLPLRSSCYSLWTPDSASPSPKSRTSSFLHQKRKKYISGNPLAELLPGPENCPTLYLTPRSFLLLLCSLLF